MRNLEKLGSLNYRLKALRSKTIKEILKKDAVKLDHPVSFWTKEDRLINGKGREFTIILKTRGCSWALGDKGGCSMCGYLQDSIINLIDDKNIISQFDYAFNKKVEEIKNSNKNYVIKLFNSGSFLDEKEISKSVRNYIFQKIMSVSNITEIVIESRVEYITEKSVNEIKTLSDGKYLEIAIGLESTDDYIRNNYINKGLKFQNFLEAVKLIKKYKLGIRIYLLFKPPFLNEQAAIDDCVKSIRELTNLKVNTISINPVNIQKDSFVEYLYRFNRYRPPWFYSLFKVFRETLKSDFNLNSIRLISDPSGAGTKRGIHNCLNKECNRLMIETLNNFVLTQDADVIFDKERYYKCDCLIKYRLQKEHFLI
ncbi:MAG: archaeosine biosynthesis radical SAM protein RaSEA [Candidatus Thorarchaeota archaeon]